MKSAVIALGSVSVLVDAGEGCFVWRVLLGARVWKFGTHATYWGAFREAAALADRIGA